MTGHESKKDATAFPLGKVGIVFVFDHFVCEKHNQGSYIV